MVIVYLVVAVFFGISGFVGGMVISASAGVFPPFSILQGILGAVIATNVALFGVAVIRAARLRGGFVTQSMGEIVDEAFAKHVESCKHQQHHQLHGHPAPNRYHPHNKYQRN